MRQPAIVRVEHDEHTPTWRTLERLASAMDATVVVELRPLDLPQSA